MTSSSFDELTKILATSTSRRQTIRALFASILGGTLGFGGMDTVQAEGDCDQSPPTDLCGNPNDNFGIWGKNVKNCVQGTGHCTAFKIDRSHTPPQWVLYHEDNKPNYTLFAGERRKGIECPKIWQMGAPNYWQFALNAGEKYLKHPHRIGLAINSRAARTECQLHIHVSCIQTEVRKQLDHYFTHTKFALDPTGWKMKIQPLTYIVNGSSKKRNFRLLYLKNLDYMGQNLFRLLHNNVVAPNNEDMADQTLVVVERQAGGFYILNSMPGLSGPTIGGTGAGEELLDETCS